MIGHCWLMSTSDLELSSVNTATSVVCRGLQICEIFFPRKKTHTDLDPQTLW